MPIPEIQAHSSLIAEITLPIYHDKVECKFHGALVKPRPDGKLYLPPFFVRTDTTIFGSYPDEPPSSQNILDIGGQLKIIIGLTRMNESRAYGPLIETIIDLSDRNPESYFPSSPICRLPYYCSHIRSSIIDDYCVPEYGDYALKTTVQRIGIDDKPKIQNINVITIERDDHKS